MILIKRFYVIICFKNNFDIFYKVKNILYSKKEFLISKKMKDLSCIANFNFKHICN